MLLKLKFVGESKGLFKYEIQPTVITPEKPATANKPITPAVTDLDDILAKVDAEGIRISKLETDGVNKTLFLPTHHYLCPTEGTVIEADVQSFTSKGSIINWFADLKLPEHKTKQDEFAKKKAKLAEKNEILALVDVWDIKGDTQMDTIIGGFDIQDRIDRRALHKARLAGVNAMNKKQLSAIDSE
jgi:hypothetical protein